MGVSVSRSHLVVWERFNANERAVVYALPPDGAMPASLGAGQEVEFDEPAYDLGSGGWAVGPGEGQGLPLPAPPLARLLTRSPLARLP